MNNAEEHRTSEAISEIADAELVALTEAQAEELLLRVSEIANSQLPLPIALEKMGQSVSPGALQQAIAATSQQLARGCDLAGALQHTQRALPLHVAGLVAASVRSGNCYHFLQSTLELRSQLRQEWREVRGALLYPSFVLLLALCVLTLVMNQSVGIFTMLVQEFQIEPSIAMASCIWFANGGQYYCAGLLIATLITSVVMRLSLPNRVWQRFHKGWPVLGSIFQAAGFAEFSQLLGLLVAEQIPLPQALRLAGAATNQEDIAASAERIALKLENGSSATVAWQAEPETFPQFWSAFMEHGGELQQLPSMLQSMSSLYLEQMQARCRFIRQTFPTLAFLFIAVSAVALTGAIYLPMLGLIQGLTFFASRGFGTGGTFAIASQWPHPAKVIALLMPMLGLMIARRMLFRHQSGVGASVMETFFHMLEWRFILFLFFGAMVGAGVLSVPLFSIALAIFIYITLQYSAMHKRLLLQRLAVCTQSQMPLPRALTLCAEELPPRMQRCALQAAVYVEQGAPLKEALEIAWIWLPYEFRFALSAAQATNTFGTTLAESLTLESRLREMQGSLLSKLMYLWALLVGMFAIMSFVWWKILPVFIKLFDEFGLDLPAITEFNIDLGNFYLRYALILVPLLVVTIVTLMIFLDPLLSRIISWVIPWVNLLWINKHGAVLLRGIAAMLKHNVPLPQALFIATRDYPIPIIASQLQKAGESLNGGGGWSDALQRYRFLTRYDAAILAAAERAGNLPWAMEEVAGHAERRLALRITWAVNIIFPICLLLMCALVGSIAVGLLLPLIALVQGLSGGPHG